MRYNLLNDMLKRKIEKKLLEWKLTPNHNPLVIKGCRQCGKTYSALNFARQNYQSVVYLNFFENKHFKEIFAESSDISRIILELSAFLGNNAQFIAGDTCIILDEIQECPQARTALKFFKIDGRFDIIATGSLLGVSGYREEPVSIPVGYETTLQMFPMDFEEFLWANNVTEEYIKTVTQHIVNVEPLSETMIARMNELLYQYAVVGGMPQVVDYFVHNHLLDNVIQLQRDIVNGYKDDMVKYSSVADKTKIRECFDSIPRQLAKENKKFQFSHVSKGGRASKFQGILKWIEDAGIIQVCHNLSAPELPLAGNAEDSVFKIYMTDIGLLISMLEDGTQYDVLKGRLYTYKGAVIENLIADFLTKAGKKLYYFRKDSGLEVDFVIRWRDECTLLECKASDGNIKSAKTILSHPEKYHVYNAIKLCDKNVGQSNGIITFPLFLGAFLFDKDVVTL